MYVCGCMCVWMWGGGGVGVHPGWILHVNRPIDIS